jgi:hypothetical protein
MPTNIKAIETMYKGYRFRSRLEARWAVFFETAGFNWEYEPQGFVVLGQPYLPDFRIHGNGSKGLWEVGIEIKPSGWEPDDTDMQKFAGLSHEFGEFLLITGNPWPDDYSAVLLSHDDTGSISFTSCKIGKCPCCGDLLTIAVDRFGAVPDEGPFVGKSRKARQQIAQLTEGTASNGFEAARSARFEHGETPPGKRGGHHA